MRVYRWTTYANRRSNPVLPRSALAGRGSLSRRLSTPSLESQARTFAADISDLLNETITHGIRLSAVLDEDSKTCVVARGVTKTKWTTGRGSGIPVRLGRGTPSGYLYVGHVLQLDDEEKYLTATKSTYALYEDEALDHLIFHYDYAREPATEKGYPDPHFQLNGNCSGLQSLHPGQTKELKDFHFPVGGRRYRPCLEDVIEFLIVEELAKPRAQWREALNSRRVTWYRRQLQAAVRRDPGAAKEMLREMGEA